MRRRTLGLSLAGAGAAILLLLLLLSPAPRNFHVVARDVESEGTLAAREARMVVWGGVVHSYDEARDRTLVLVAFCSHRLCGPGVWLAGDLRSDLPDGPWLLVPEGPVATEPVGGPDEPGRFPPSEEVNLAFTPTWSIRPSWTSLAPRALAYGLLAVGLALALPRLSERARDAVAIAAGAGVALGLLMRGSLWPIHLLLNLVGVLSTLVGLAVGLSGLGLRRNRLFAAGAGMVFASAAFFLVGPLAVRHFPASGAGD